MKKKGILLALLVLALTLTVAVATAECAHTSTHYEHDQEGHWQVCDDCGITVGYHYAHADPCDQPDGVCDECGATGVIIHLDHLWNSLEWHITDTTHEGVCPRCGQMAVESESHYDFCSAPGVCGYCGATGVTMGETNHGVRHYEYDQTACWEVCDYCGAIAYGPWKHAEFCTNPGVCCNCGATGVTIGETYHSGGWHYEHDQTTHWEVCDTCGNMSFEPRGHYELCSNPGVCDGCGATGVLMADTLHGVDRHFEYDQTTHWEVCDTCGGRTLRPYVHRSYCNNPDVCVDCGATGVTMAYTDHPSESFEWHVTDTTHEAVCTLCGQIAYESEEHFEWCDKPGVCIICEATGVTMGSRNHFSSHVEHDQTTHWAVCNNCGEISSEPEAHYTDEGDLAGICSYCGTVYSTAPAEPVQLNGVTVSGDLTVGGTLTATIDATGATYYSFWVYDSSFSPVLEAYMTASNTYSFTLSNPGDYVVVVSVTDGVTTASGNGDWFTVTGDQVAISGIAISGDQMVGSSVTATVSATGATYYSYWVYNGQGELVSEAYMTTSNTYSFTPAKPSIYNVFVTVSDGTNIAQENSGWFPVEGDPVVINSLTVTGDKKPGSPLTATIDAPGATGFSYWFYNADGTLLEEAYMVTTSSYTFTPEAPGGYNIFVAVTDGVSSDQKNSGWFMVE